MLKQKRGMKSDKFDSFIKDQINDLDRVPVPGTTWKPEISWEKINSEMQPRRKIIIWWYSGAAASVLLLLALLGVWSLGFEKDNSGVTENKPEKSNNIEMQNPKETITDNALISEIGFTTDNLPKVETDNENSKIENNKVRSVTKRNQGFMASIAYLKPDFQLQNTEIEWKNPAFRQIRIENPAQQNEPLAVNRTYIIKKVDNKNFLSEKDGSELSVQINLTMKSEENPPGGFLANIYQ